MTKPLATKWENRKVTVVLRENGVTVYAGRMKRWEAELLRQRWEPLTQGKEMTITEVPDEAKRH